MVECRCFDPSKSVAYENPGGGKDELTHLRDSLVRQVRDNTCCYASVRICWVGESGKRAENEGRGVLFMSSLYFKESANLTSPNVLCLYRRYLSSVDFSDYLQRVPLHQSVSTSRFSRIVLLCVAVPQVDDGVDCDVTQARAAFSVCPPHYIDDHNPSDGCDLHASSRPYAQLKRRLTTYVEGGNQYDFLVR